MRGNVGDAPTASKAKPTITVPPRGSMGFVFANGSAPGFSPGPMTLVSTFFPEQSPFSFSQLLAGAMASPLTPNPGFLPAYGYGEEAKGEDFSDKPTNLVAAAAPQLQLESLSPLFMVPPGLSPSGLLNSPGYLSPLQSPFGISHQQALAQVTAQAALSQSFKQMQAGFQHFSSTNAAEAVASLSSSVQTEALTQPPTNLLPPEPENSKKESSEVAQSDKRTAYVAGEKPASDGYNWRKYGQKHVKASECPRSYYKCTHPNCPVKKKVERSLDGHISEITYRGQHNHDPPKLNKWEKESCALDIPTDSQMKAVSNSHVQIEADLLNETVTVNSESGNPPATSNISFDRHSVAIHSDDMEGAAIVMDEKDVVEPIPKRKSLDTGLSLPTLSHQAVPESKIVLQTRSEVDLLDDGYKWRKYGQKVVKGNPHPRSYYRCTYAGCNVRKHVERASADPKSVITTYEGKHNHDIPMGKYSSHSATNANPQQLKTQDVVPENHSLNTHINFGNKDQMPTTLQLKEERIAA